MAPDESCYPVSFVKYRGEAFVELAQSLLEIIYLTLAIQIRLPLATRFEKNMMERLQYLLASGVKLLAQKGEDNANKQPWVQKFSCYNFVSVEIVGQLASDQSDHTIVVHTNRTLPNNNR